MKNGVIKVDGAKIGLLSGMGPLAGGDVLQKVLRYAAEKYGAVEDSDYPDIALLSHGIAGFDAEGTLHPNFAAELSAMAKEMNAGKPSVIGVACNTAHICFDTIKQAVQAPVVHLPKAVAKEAAKYDGSFLLLCSHATKKSGMYHAVLQEAGVKFVELTEQEQNELDAAVGLVMAFKLSEAAAKIAPIVQSYQDVVDGYIVGCTELPIAFALLPLHTKICIDSNMVLAKALTDHCYQKVSQAPYGEVAQA